MKNCTDCKTKKPLTEFRIRKNYNNSKTVYRSSICNKCLVNRSRAWQEKNPERYRTYQNEYHRKEYIRKARGE